MSKNIECDVGYDIWLDAKQKNNWEMPDFPRWQMLPVLHWFCWVFYILCAAHREMAWLKAGLVASGYDNWVAFGFRYGWK